MSRPCVVRIAPSPTGDPHVGTAYIALFNYAFAKQQGGKFILRIEDTDQARSTPQSEGDILRSLKWLGISWDEGPDVGGPNGPYRQSERLEIYKKHVDQLVASGHAYWCTCSEQRLTALRKQQEQEKASVRGYDGHCRHREARDVDAERKAGAAATVRLKIPREPGSQTRFLDSFRGEQVWDNQQIDDQVILKSDGFPTYHLANIVDDHLMGVTHVLRGEEWLSSTPKHVLLYEAFGWEPPVFAHLPLLRNADKSKVSKRKNPVSLNYFRECGYFPDAMINFLGMMAFTFEDGREIFSLQDFVEHFKVERVVLGGPVFDLKKLLWLNGRYLREQRTDEQLVSYLKEQLFTDEYLLQIVKLAKERFEKSEDFVDYAPYFFTGAVSCQPQDLLVKGKTRKESLAAWETLVEKVDGCFDFSAPRVDQLLKDFCESTGLTPKELFMPLRWMVTGKKATPPLPETMAVLGRERVRSRMRAALDALKKMSDPLADPAPQAPKAAPGAMG